MWAGMTSDVFEKSSQGMTVTHRPTGIVLNQPASVPHGIAPGPTVVTSLNDPSFCVEIDFYDQFDRYRTDQGITSDLYDELGVVNLRIKYGALIDLRSAQSVGGRAIAWNRSLVQSICDLKFYAMAIPEYDRGEMPDPNRINVTATEIPADLHGLYHNLYIAGPSQKS